MRAFIKRWRRACIVSCVAVAVVALAACGGDEPDAAPAQPQVASETQPAAAPTVAATQPAATNVPNPTAITTTESAPPTAIPEPTAAPTVAATAVTAAPSVEVGLDVGQRAPDFSLTSHEGESITRASLEGRPVLLYFYTTW